MSELDQLRKDIFDRVVRYYQLAHAQRPFIPGETRVGYAGRVWDEREMINMVDAVLEFWLTAGRYAQEFERRLGEFLDVREVIPVNSGSSANLVAITALTSSRLDRPLKPGDEVPLQLGILLSDPKISTECVSEQNVVSPLRVADVNDMDVNRAHVGLRFLDKEIAAIPAAVPTRPSSRRWTSTTPSSSKARPRVLRSRGL